MRWNQWTRRSLFLLIGTLSVIPLTMAEEATTGKTPLPAKPSNATPNWAKAANTPLWSFVWLSDMHIGTAKPEFIAKAFQEADRSKPHFVLITGDNNFIEAPPADPQKQESLGLRRQRFLKNFFQENLKTPYVLIPGNNWPEEFDKVFGPKQYSFDCGGLHFLLVDADRAYRGGPGQNIEGFTAFNDATFDWIARDLDRHRQQPIVFAIHEPICPLTFVEARRLRNLLDQHPNVFLVLQGHLHMDMEFHRNGVTYLVAPSLAKTPTPAFKLVEAYPEGLIVRTIPYDKSSETFVMTKRRQVVELPKQFRGSLTNPATLQFAKTNYDCVPAHPFVDDPSLASRRSDLMKNALDLLDKNVQQIPKSDEEAKR